jgi:hypothetical protein
MPDYAKAAPRGEWIVTSDPHKVYAPDRLRLFVTGRGLPRWAEHNTAFGDAWGRPLDKPASRDYLALVVEGTAWLPAFGTTCGVEVVQAPTAADMAVLRTRLARRRLGAM